MLFRSNPSARHSGMVLAGIQRYWFDLHFEKPGFPMEAFGNDEKVALQ
jgi:hypothetical protein